jgi:ubiquinone/menaquinone biosynthesis C-methylase UbiE
MAPFLFQAARSARDLGLLAALKDAGPNGSGADELTTRFGLPATSVTTLLDALLAGGLLDESPPGRWRLTTTGVVWLDDPQVGVDAEFTHAVCWHGLADLRESLVTGTPAGLRRLGPWATVYEGLAHLPEEIRGPWFAYDHGHSDSAFPAALKHLAGSNPRRLLDVGANTGRFSLAALHHLPHTQVTLLDHPGQLAEAEVALTASGLRDRATFLALDLLDHTLSFPSNQDAVWMSQFLDCFGPVDVHRLLCRARAALAPGGSVWVLEVCPDRQGEAAAAASLRLASLYFTAIANGVSRFYRATDLLELAAEAGLELAEQWDGIGTAHSLFRLVQAQKSK